MKRVKFLLITYLLFIVLFSLEKPIFLLFHWEESASKSFLEYLGTMWYGLPMDMSVAGYFTAIPGLVLLASVFVSPRICSRILQVYFLLVSVFTSLLFVPDLELYKFWGFRIDATILTYISQPAEAMASLSGWVVAGMTLLTIAVAVIRYYLLNRFVAKPVASMEKAKRKIMEPTSVLLLLGLMFIAIRGGVTTSTMNIGRVYFSEDIFLNHTAINPVFSMLSSFKQSKQAFDQEYRFMPDTEATQVFEEAFTVPAFPRDSLPSLLNTDRPNIVFILLESFGAVVTESVGGLKGVTPHLDRLASEGVLFNKMYANSFRTDRGIVSALAGYPAQPTLSLIKYPKKSDALRSIMSSVKENGYQTSFLYGGDVDFAYIKSFFVSQKVTDITRDTDFPVKELLNKWGAPDHITFPRLLKEMREAKEMPYMKTFLTLSSHEPFDVPYAHFDDPYVNSVAYTDSCLGSFVDELKQLPEWDNTLLILVPDHDMRYPYNIEYYAPERHDIFMIWAGGAVKERRLIEKICSQADIATTLLSQLNIDTKDFPFSRDILAPTYKQLAFYTFPNGFGVIDTSGYTVFDCGSMHTMLQQGPNSDSLTTKGQAILQKLYDDIAAK